MTFQVSEVHRMKEGPLGSDSTFGNNGAFAFSILGVKFFAIASDGEGWEHVSVRPVNLHRPPTWGEMCQVKDMFWGDEDEVVQFHPKKSEYVNLSQNCLHLWRSVKGNIIPVPPSILVGPKG